MRVNRFIASIFVVILAVFTTFAQAEEKITFTGTEVFDPLGIMGAPVGQFLDLGTVQCPGNTPTGNPAQPCPDGSRTHLRGTKHMSRFTSPDPRFTGWFIIEGNANLAPDFTGPQWGTYTLRYDLGGEATGSWQGVRVKEGDHWVTPLHATIKITGGSLDGAKGVSADRIVGFTPMPILYVGMVEATLVRVPKN